MTQRRAAGRRPRRAACAGRPSTRRDVAALEPAAQRVEALRRRGRAGRARRERDAASSSCRSRSRSTTVDRPVLEAHAQPVDALRAPSAAGSRDIARAGARSARSIRARKLSARSTTSSAAFDGVAARTSATKSAIVKSTSWPTAEITGTGQAAIARASRSSLNAQRSSADPPPRPMMTTSTSGTRAIARSARTRSARRLVALHARGAHHDARGRMPRREDAQDVAHGRAVERRHDADAAGQHRQRTLPRGVEQALGLQLALQLLERGLQRAEPVRLERVARSSWYSPLTSYTLSRPRATTRMPSSGVNFSVPRRSCGTSPRGSARSRPSA